MTDTALSDEIALRIGLAARALPDTSPARLLRVLAAAVGLPPTADKLAALKVRDLKTAANGDLAEIDSGPLKDALALLQGEGISETAPPPAVEPDGDLPGSIRVACASNGGELLDGHFGSCRRFLVYQVSGDAARLVAVRNIDDSQAEDKSDYRASLIADCQILYIVSIGGPAAAKVVKRDIHPVKLPDGGHAGEQMQSLRQLLDDKPPPWLAKAMGHAPDDRVRFERDAA